MSGGGGVGCSWEELGGEGVGVGCGGEGMSLGGGVGCSVAEAYG
jgi:hypothetical protein